MKKTVLLLIAFASVLFATAQKKKKDWSKIDIDRAGDHFMLQVSSDHWAGVPDSISSHMKGFSRGLNFYIMLDKRFKNNPHWSVALGLGVSSSSMFFKKMDVNVNAAGTVLPFDSLDNQDHFKKYKLATSYLEIPVELRYAFNPEKENKSVKIALGVKIGTMLNAHVKGKTLQDKNNTTINNYVAKENSRRFFNSTRLSATARIGYGHYSVFGSYQLNTFLKDGAGASSIKPFQVGFTFSGL